MKKILLIAMLFRTAQSFGQTQELKQLSLDIEKLAQLKLILSQAYQGYTILESGYRNIKDIAQGNYNLHKDFLDGLLAVSPAVRNYKKVAEIINAQASIVSEYKTALARVKQQSIFDPSEMDGIAADYQNLITETADAVTQLYAILSPGALRMNDSERIEAIDRLAEYVNGKLAALRKYNNKLVALAALRMQAQKDLKTLQGLF